MRITKEPHILTSMLNDYNKAGIGVACSVVTSRLDRKSNGSYKKEGTIVIQPPDKYGNYLPPTLQFTS